MLQAILIISAFGVAFVYFAIAALVVPRISLGAATARFQFLVRLGGTLFFVGCGLTHLHIAAHAFGAGATAHEVGFHMLQLVGGVAFVVASLRYLSIRVEPRVLEEHLRRNEELEDLSIRDPLTGAYNRRFHDEALAKWIDRSRHQGSVISVAHMDVDNLKEINDESGHAVGDEVLRLVATTAASVMRASDSIIRIGGDEFVLLFPETSREEAQSAVERLHMELAALPVRAEGISVSVGVASWPADGSDAATLSDAADRALYAVKRRG